jgi:hypothetical protein
MYELTTNAYNNSVSDSTPDTPTFARQKLVRIHQP